MIYQTWNKGLRKARSPRPLHALVFCLYYCTKPSRHAGQIIHLKPAASPSDFRQLIVLMHSHRKISDSRGMDLLAERDLGSVQSHQEQLKSKKMRMSDQRIYPRRQGRHHMAEHGRDGRRLFDLQTKIALALAKNDDRSLHKYAPAEHTELVSCLLSDVTASVESRYLIGSL
jgi:hypothetical protein